MKRSTPVLVEIIINAVISLILYNIAIYTVFAESSPFNSHVQGFLLFFLGLSLLDMIWKLLKDFISKKKKK